MSEIFTAWGGERAKGARAVSLKTLDFSRLTTPALPYGDGRSYGDSCLLSGGAMIEGRDRNRILAFDGETGLLTAEAGIRLCDIIAFAAPLGWFPAVLPGTRFVTLGGAIANDIHGKNHHRRGSFGCHVERLVLERSDKGLLVSSPRENADLFAATISGFGLTGVIREATIRLMRVPSTQITEVTTRFDRLEDYFELAAEADERHEYAVAWIDSLATGKNFGRGHLIAGDHAIGGELEGSARPALATIPLTPPVSPLIGPGLKAFNELYYRKARPGTSERTVPFDGFFFPLDRIGRWNRLYGPRGLCQHQCVLPEEAGADGVRALLDAARTYKQGSFLTVLKRFGALASPGLTSFPRPGYTLTLDFPHRGEKTLRLLAELDRITIEAGGAINPYKHARAAPETFAASFPRWRELEAFRDPALLSDFWHRTVMAGLVENQVMVSKSQKYNSSQNPAFTLKANAKLVNSKIPAL